MSAAERILVVGPAWVGDMVMAQSLLKLLRARDPQAAIDVVGPPAALPVALRMPEVRRTWLLDVAHGQLGLGARWRLAAELRAERYDRAIVLPRSFKSALVPLLAAIPQRTGFATELRRLVLNDPRPLDRSLLDQTVKRFLALGLPVGAPLPDPARPQLRVDKVNCARLLATHRLNATRAVALMPGASYGPAKQWPPEHFAELARALTARGNEVWVLGSSGEQPLGELICRDAGPAARNLCGATRLEDTVDLLAGAQAAVTNDSGLMHVAAAAGTAVVALYGSSSPAFTPPLTPRATILHLGLDCSPCFARECPLGHLRCLREISAAQVLASLPT
jgi:heptosyltransferase-2